MTQIINSMNKILIYGKWSECAQSVFKGVTGVEIVVTDERIKNGKVIEESEVASHVKSVDCVFI